MPLIVVGSANMDLVVRAPRLPAPGETLIGSSFATFPGGKGANQAVAAARLGGDVRFVGQVGADAFGDALRAQLVAACVEVSRLRTNASIPTGIAVITVDEAGQNTIVVSPGANGAVTADQALSAIGPGDAVLLQLEIPIDEVYAILRQCSSSLRILNPAPAAQIPDDVYPAIDVITPNESEASWLTGVPVVDETSAEEAAEVLLRRGVGQVVVTLGPRGLVSTGRLGSARIPARKVAAIDTVAAGDAFSGALALFLSQGRTFHEALELANVTAAISTTRQGAQASMPTLEEVTAFRAE